MTKFIVLLLHSRRTWTCGTILNNKLIGLYFNRRTPLVLLLVAHIAKLCWWWYVLMKYMCILNGRNIFTRLCYVHLFASVDLCLRLLLNIDTFWVEDWVSIYSRYQLPTNTLWNRLKVHCKIGRDWTTHSLNQTIILSKSNFWVLNWYLLMQFEK